LIRFHAIVEAKTKEKAMIDYLEKQKNGWIVLAHDGKTDEIDIPIQSILNRIALQRLSTLDARVRATKKVFHLRSRVPIWLTEAVLLIPLYGIRSEKMCLINYFAIRSTKKSQSQSLIICFRDGLVLTDVPITLFQSRMDLCEQILRHMTTP
jgi:hypothetical protein